MADISFDLPDTKNDALRALVVTIERELGSLDRPVPEGGGVDPLKAAWADLVAKLDLGVAAVSRACPNCKRLSREAATVCFYCWSKLPAVEAG